MMGLILFLIAVVSIAACMTYDIRYKHDHPTHVRVARGFVMGVVTALGITVVFSLVNIAALLILGA